MSVFKVFFGGTANYNQEFEGTKIAGREFHKYWTPGGGQKIFQDFIVGLIEQHICIVTYKDETKVVSVKTTGHGAKHLVYSQGGHERQVHPKAEKDNPNNDVVSMAVPSEAVQPDVGNTAAYLGDALDKLSDPRIGDSDKRAFLLGLLLLKRCR